MIKDELKKEAEDIVYGMGYDTYEEDGHSDFAVQDLLVKFAEPREKQIAELEKKLAISEHDREHNDYELAEVYKKVSELEKENAELKKQLEMSNKVYNDNLDYSHHIEEQLTTAKETIRSLYFVIQDRIDYKGNIPLEDEMYRANQFLNSEVEK